MAVFERSKELKDFFLDPIKDEKKYLEHWDDVKGGTLNPDLRYSIVMDPQRVCYKRGMFSLINAIIPYLEDARRHGRIPVVDLTKLNVPMWHEPELRYKENAWELYFEQPIPGTKLSEVMKSKNVKRLNGEYSTSRNRYAFDLVTDGKVKDQKYWCKVWTENIHIKKDIRDRARAFAREQKFRPRDVMGVSIRAGYKAYADNGNAIVKGHPVVGSVEHYIAMIERNMKKWGYDRFYLCVDDRYYSDTIKAHFGDACIRMDRHLVTFFGEDGSLLENTKENLQKEYRLTTLVDKNKEYIAELLILSRCGSLMGSMGGSSAMPFFLNNMKYKHVDFDFEAVN